MSACPVIAWAGRATSRRGRTSCYRVVVRLEVAAALRLAESPVDPRKLYTIEKCVCDAMGESSWHNCGHSPPKDVILQMALALAEAKGGAA